MIQPTKFLTQSSFLCVMFLCGAAQSAPVSVLAPVVQVKGSSSWAGPGSTKSGKLQTGASLAEGSAIQTSPASQVSFSPVPGIVVTVAKSTSLSVLRLQVTKSGETLQKRDVVLRLDSGTLSFSLDKKIAGKTSFVIITPHGTMVAERSVGTITVAGRSVALVSLSGKATYTPNGGQVGISVEPGSFLTVSGEGGNAQIQVINGIAKTTTDFSPDGTPIGTREATGLELQSMRGLLESTLAHASIAAASGRFGTEAMAEMTSTLIKVNQSFVAAGLAQVGPPTVAEAGESPENAGAEPAPVSTGFSGGLSNPANISGLPVSREQ